MNGTDIIEVAQDVPAITDTSLVQLAEQAERRIDAMNKIKKCALKMTNPGDWTDQGGKPYLQVSGSEKVARLFGISWRIDEPTYEIEPDGHFSYTYKGYFTLSGVTIEAIGTRSSKDGFFKKYEGKGDNRTELPPSAIDKGDVKKAAYTNLLGNGITRLLGLRNMTWADLEEFAGIKQAQVSGVKYKEKGQNKEGIASEGSQVVTATVADVKMQTKKKDGSAMKTPLYIIHAGEAEYKTFSESIAKTAKEAKDAGRNVTITFTVSKYGNDAESVAFADDGPKDPGSPARRGKP